MRRPGSKKPICVVCRLRPVFVADLCDPCGQSFDAMVEASERAGGTFDLVAWAARRARRFAQRRAPATAAGGGASMSSRLKWKRVEEGEGKPGDRYKLRVGDLSTAMVAVDGPRWYFYSLLAKAPKNTLFEQPPRTWDDPEGARTAAGAWARGVLQQVA